MQTKKIAAPLVLDRATLLARMQEAPGQRFNCGQLARQYKVSSAAVRAYLDQLINANSVRTAVDGRRRVYWAPTPAESAGRAGARASFRTLGDLTGYEAYLRRGASLRAGA